MEVEEKLTETKVLDTTPEQASEPTLEIPDYLASPNAVFSDEGVEWRYGKPPDYSKTRQVWKEGEPSFQQPLEQIYMFSTVS